MKRVKSKTPLFLTALYFSKVLTIIIKTFFKDRGTNMPGVWAIKLCPDFLSRIEIPPKIIAVTGANGKTSVSNLINDVLVANDYSVINNGKGSNMDTGIASALIEKANFLGKVKEEYAVFEVDERVSARIYNHIEPTLLLCTNLTRDSIKRNGHSEFIFEKINSAIPNNTTLILNGNDLISSSLAPKNKRVYFSVENILNKSTKNIVQDVSVCPKCQTKLTFDHIHHHHIGQSHCDSCGFKSPTPDFNCVLFKNDKITIKEKNTSNEYNIISDTIYNIYNVTGAVAALRTVGLRAEQINNGIKSTNLIADRESQFKKGDLEVITLLAKNQNPVSSSLALDYSTNLDGNKVFVLMITDTLDKKHGHEDISWLYDTDFEFLNKKNVNQIVACGSRCYDLGLRLLIAGIPKEKIILKENYNDIEKELNLNNIDKIIVAYELYGYNLAIELKNKIIGDEND